LNVKPEDCLFVGDGGSNELPGAVNAGMKAVQAKWFSLDKNKNNAGSHFKQIYEPLEIINILK